MKRRAVRAQSRRKQFLGVAMGLVLAAGFAISIRAAVATENTDPDILALMAQLPNDQAPGACDVPKATSAAKASAAAPSKSAAPSASESAPASASPSASESASPSASASPSDKPSSATGCAHGGQGGPFASDFIKIANVIAKAREATPGRGASKGTFVSACGRNENNHHNPDNFIVAPGVSNGAHHVHDYVGNLSTDGFSTDQSLAAAGTTCKGNDKSAYFWPVLRTRGKTGPDAEQPGGGPDGNIGTILRPAQVTLEFRGNAKGKVRAMPKFLRIITGDAKAGANGLANARAAWTCTGFEDRTTTKYPICPQGSNVERILDFPSCWDGKNTDSANHRSHIVFPKNDGSCWQKTVAVPQLRMVLTYAVPAKSLFSLDTFPEQKHNPLTDHADFTNVMPDSLMKQAVDCINSGSDCDADGPVAADPGAGTPTPTPTPTATASQGQEAPPVPPAASPTASPAKSADAQTPTSASRSQGGQRAQPAQPAQPTRAAAAGRAEQPVRSTQAPTPGPTPGGSAQAAADGSSGGDRPSNASNARPGSAGDAGNGRGAAPAQVDTATRQLAEPPLSDTAAATGGVEGAKSGAQAGVPAGAPAGALPGAPGAPATNQAAAPAAASNRTLLYVLNGAALAALAGWLTVMMRRRRFR